MEETKKVRKIHSKHCRWTRFFRVKNQEKVYIGKKPAVKLSFCTAIFFGPDFAYAEDYFLVNPFRWVKTEQSVKRSVISGTIEKVLTRRSPFATNLSGEPFPENAGKTHCVGDSCPGGHHEIAKQVGPASVAKSMVIPQGGEPHNDNNITGPSC